jgi:two-component system, OmpR family, response regulator ChvI
MPTQTMPDLVAPLDTQPELPQSSLAEDRKIRVVLVDDDDGFCELAAGELEYLGFEVDTYYSGEALLEARTRQPGADVIVLDWKLQSELGPDLLREMRKQGISEPVVFFTGLSTTTYEIAALDCGAVDFVDKARGMPILAKRLRRIVDWKKQQSGSSTRQSLRAGRLTLKSEVAGAFWDDENIGLTLTEFNVVYLLASRMGEYVAYRAIYDCVHHEGFVAGDGDNGYRTNVRSLIKRIRNKFRAFDADFSEIENFAALGYRWRSHSAISG